MFRQIFHTSTVLLIILLMVSISAASAQDETAPTDTGSDTPSDGLISFEDYGDSSLFVGHYRLNPGDTIVVEVITDTSRVYYPMIDDGGYVTIPVLGRVNVMDMTATEARQILQENADLFYRNAWITVRVGQIGKVKFYVYGDVRLPGFYTAPGSTTFFDFLQTFGLAGLADHRRIVHVKGDITAALPEPVDLIGGERTSSAALIRESLDHFSIGETDLIDPRVTILDPLDFTLEGEIESRNFYLEYGDVIYVPDPGKIVSIEGFRRPGVYEILPGETWANIIAMAGEPTHLRDIANIILERRDENGKLSQLYYNLNLLDEDSLASVPLEHRDILKALNYEVSVYVLGEVTTAGAFPYNASLSPLDYIALAGGDTPEAHLKFARIIRPPRDPNAPLEESRIFEANLVDMIVDGAPMASVQMEPGDILYIPAKGDSATISTVLTGLSVLVNAVRLFQ